jgi:hypothetical protein
VTVPVDVQAERNNAVTNRMAFIAALFWNRLNVAETGATSRSDRGFAVSLCANSRFLERK